MICSIDLLFWYSKYANGSYHIRVLLQTFQSHMFPQQTNLLKYRGNFRYDRERKRRQRSVQMPTEEQCLRIEIQIIIRVLMKTYVAK